MLASLPPTVARLKTADTFQQGAAEVLQPMLDRAAAALQAGGVSGRILRGVAHLRSEESYSTIAVCEAGDAPGDDTERLSSSSAWRWVQAHDRPVEIDVLFGKANLVERPDEPLQLAPQATHEFVGGVSHQLLMARGTTHLVVLPLRDERSQLRGMVSLEAQARDELGRTFVWATCLQELSTWLDVTGPFLCALPADAAQADSDPLLPVCGHTMAPIVRLLRVFAAQDETLLLSGPTGVGKSRMAAFCHAHSARAEAPFETVDLLSVPPDMQVAELFGWKKGAFTGATRDHDGYVKRAAGGTLFLDEIDKLSLAAQASLLRLLETRRFRPLGSAGADQQAEVRFIVGTNTDLLAEVRDGRFREDLYYRIQVLATRLPPLSQRADEVVPWAEYMLRRRAEEAGRTGSTAFAEDARTLLAAARWPGNLRQLDNAVRRAFVIAAADAPSLDQALVISSAHIDASLHADGGAETAAPIAQALSDAARAFVQSLSDQALIELDDAAIFRAHVLAAAIAHTGEVEQAFRLLRRENLVRNRNHHKAVDRELERARAFYAALGVPAPSWLIAALTR